MALKRDIARKISKTSLSYYYFFKKIKGELKRLKWNRECPSGVFFVEFQTSNFNYDWDAIELVTKSFKRLGWDAKIKRYSTNVDGIKGSCYYKWQIEKGN